jgi:hypothetical protein
MALTLLEANKYDDGDIKKTAVIEMFAENSDLLRTLPIENINGASWTYNLEEGLPAVGFRGINEAFTESTGVINPQTERLRIAGGDIDVDLQLIAQNGASTRSSQEAMKIKAMALTITGKIINGVSAVQPREFDGLRTRIGGSQLVEATTTPGANGALSLFKLDEAIDAVDGATHLLMSKAMRNRITSGVRANVGGDLIWELDEIGNRVAVYNGIPILIVDVDETDTKIIAFDEAGPAGGSVSTSLYVVAFGDEKIMGFQNGSIDVRDLGEVDDKPVVRTRVEWAVGLVVQHGRAAARIWGITNVAIVA